MRFTALGEIQNLGKPTALAPGDQADWAPENVQPLLDIGAAVRGHLDITPEAAQLARDEEVDVTDIEGSGQDGRIVVSDVRAEVEGAKPGEDDVAPDDVPEPEPVESDADESEEEPTTFGDLPDNEESED